MRLKPSATATSACASSREANAIGSPGSESLATVSDAGVGVGLRPPRPTGAREANLPNGQRDD